MRLVGLGGGTGGCLAWGGTGGGILESAEEAAGMGREGKSSVIRETVLGGLAIGTSLEEEQDEEEEDEEGGVAYAWKSEGRLVEGLGGSKACLSGGGSCLESGAGRGLGAKIPAESKETGGQTNTELRRSRQENTEQQSLTQTHTQKKH